METRQDDEIQNSALPYVNAHDAGVLGRDRLVPLGPTISFHEDLG